MKKIFPIVLLTLALASCSQEKKMIRRASNAVERSDFDKAIMYYNKVLSKDSNSFYANAGKGIVLSEYVGNYEAAIPYLEKALVKAPKKDNKIKINKDLGRSYHFVGNYPRALYYYGKAEPYNKESDADYDVFLSKRIADCKYALEHPAAFPSDKVAVTNIGNKINTPMPEYGAVYTNGELIFTSKRQDTPSEKKNGLDGRYFEAMYMSKVNADGSLTEPRLYKVGEPALQLRKYGESVVSVSHDGKTLYTYKAGKIYETPVNDSTDKPHELSKTINFSHVQNHACLASDGKTLFFTSESETEGRGGSDIYKSIKNEDGTWAKPQIMDYSINTSFDEEAPYIDNNGTLFFASNGLPGYGGFDIFKTHMENGKWTTPENLGQPINSAGDDIYFVLNDNSYDGYYSSARPGGYGDMDIYKVRYVSEEGPQCQPADTSLMIFAMADSTNQSSYNFALAMPEHYKNNIRSVYWTVNGQPLSQTTDKLQYTFNGANNYTVNAKVIAYCDTCPAIISMCSETVIAIQSPIVRNKDSLNTSLTNNNNLAVNDRMTSSANTKKNSKTNKLNNYNNSNAVASASKINESYLSDEQLKAMNWNPNYEYFSYNQSQLSDDAKAVLNQNIAVLKNNADLKVVINGYADSRGPAAYNKSLSAKRANMVKDYLLNNGVSKSKIKAVNAYGETHLVNNCADGVECSEEQHQLNRRVKFEVYENVKTPATITLR